MRQLKVVKSITSRDSIALNKYLQEISHYPMVTVEEEVELAQKIKKGDQWALNRLVCANLRFAFTVAKQYEGQGLPLIDLVNEANIGLIKAAEKFDETRGFKFISYAVWWIRQSILQSIAEKARVIRLPLNQVGMVSKINKVASQFEQQNLRKPTTEELATYIDVPEEKIDEVLQASGRPLSIDAPLVEGEDSSLIDVMAATDIPTTDKALLDESLSKEVDSALEMLSEREREVIKMSFGIGCQEISLDEIGFKLNLTRERVRQIKDKAIRTLRYKRSRELETYL